MAQNHLGACPTLKTGLKEDCSCKKEIFHYLNLAMWTLGIFLFELWGGYSSGSQALISDSLHLLMDLGENILSVLVVVFAIATGWNEKKLRAIAGFLSALLLLIAGYIIVKEGIEHFSHPHKIEWFMGFYAIVTLFVVEKQLKHHHKAPAVFKNITHWWQWAHLVFDKWALRVVILGWFIMLISDGQYWIDGALSIGIGSFIIAFTIARLSGINLHPHDNNEDKSNKDIPHSHGPGCNHKH